jgi:hypothetical protein
MKVLFDVGHDWRVIFLLLFNQEVNKVDQKSYSLKKEDSKPLTTKFQAHGHLNFCYINNFYFDNLSVFQHSISFPIG